MNNAINESLDFGFVQAHGEINIKVLVVLDLLTTDQLAAYLLERQAAHAFLNGRENNSVLADRAYYALRDMGSPIPKAVADYFYATMGRVIT